MNTQAYYAGFFNKCAEYGIDGNALLAKLAQEDAVVPVGGATAVGATGGGLGGLALSLPWLLASGAGAGIGALTAKKDPKTGLRNRIKGALKGALWGIPLGGLAAGAVGGGYLGNRAAKGLNSLVESAQSGDLEAKIQEKLQGIFDQIKAKADAAQKQ